MGPHIMCPEWPASADAAPALMRRNPRRAASHMKTAMPTIIRGHMRKKSRKGIPHTRLSISAPFLRNDELHDVAPKVLDLDDHQTGLLHVADGIAVYVRPAHGPADPVRPPHQPAEQRLLAQDM